MPGIGAFCCRGAADCPRSPAAGGRALQLPRCERRRGEGLRAAPAPLTLEAGGLVLCCLARGCICGHLRACSMEGSLAFSAGVHRGAAAQPRGRLISVRRAQGRATEGRGSNPKQRRSGLAHCAPARTCATPALRTAAARASRGLLACCLTPARRACCARCGVRFSSCACPRLARRQRRCVPLAAAAGRLPASLLRCRRCALHLVLLPLCRRCAIATLAPPAPLSRAPSLVPSSRFRRPALRIRDRRSSPPAHDSPLSAPYISPSTRRLKSLTHAPLPAPLSASPTRSLSPNTRTLERALLSAAPPISL
jgi:hypothetical protein